MEKHQIVKTCDYCSNSDTWNMDYYGEAPWKSWIKVSGRSKVLNIKNKGQYEETLDFCSLKCAISYLQGRVENENS